MTDIWVLTDHRTGTATQAIALAEALGMQYEIKKLVYNAIALVPNFLLGATMMHINTALSSNLDDTLPKIIISAGRRTASVAIALKKRDANIKVIQIMRPFLDASKFDLIVLPQHDTFNAHGNIIRIIGSLHNAQTKLQSEYNLFMEEYPTTTNFIAVLVGGGTKKYTFSQDDAKRLTTTLSTISANHGIPLFISFSRRTPKNVQEIFQEVFAWPHIMYDPTTSTKRNPYYGILAAATFIVSTCDSISMCSEATASGKPLYIFCPSNPNALPKHRYFIQQLIDLGLARLLHDDMETLTHYTYSPLNEAHKVAEYIKEHVL